MNEASHKSGARPRRPGPRGGMARAEWLILSGILILVLGIAGPLAWNARRSDRIRQARSDIITVHQAVMQYYRDTGELPAPADHAGRDTRYGDIRRFDLHPNADVLNRLRGVVASAAGGTAYVDFPRYSGGRGGLSDEGELLDPWGTPYQLVLDNDLNNSCSIDRSIYGVIIGETVVIWSCGPDGETDTDDDICSWRLGSSG